MQVKISIFLIIASPVEFHGAVFFRQGDSEPLMRNMPLFPDANQFFLKFDGRESRISGGFRILVESDILVDFIIFRFALLLLCVLAEFPPFPTNDWNWGGLGGLIGILE